MNAGTAMAWGDNTYGQTNVPAGLSNVVAVAGGYFHSLALKADGTVAAWGSNVGTNVPAGLTNVIGLAGGHFQGLALVGSAPWMRSAPISDPLWTGRQFELSVLTQVGRVCRLEYLNSW